MNYFEEEKEEEVERTYTPNRHGYTDEFSPGMWPRAIDLLEINALSIVSDCRAIISGNLVPRSWKDISCSWKKDDSLEPVVKNTARYKGKEYDSNHISKKNSERYKRKKKERNKKLFDALIQDIIDLGDRKQC